MREPAQQPRFDRAAPGRPALSVPAHLLVVEDEPRSRKLLEGYLRAEGYRVESAVDGSSGLETVRHEPPDVVLLDVMMPGMTGHQVCAEIKTDPRTRTCQVMLVTALASTADVVTGLDTGADDYLTKPVRREELLAKVRALLRARRLLLEIEAARAALAARNEELELKKTLAQTLVHDLKSPLAAILGNLELLELRADDGVRPLVRRAVAGATRMNRMILDLLDVERLESGRLAPDRDAVDALAILEAAIDEATASATLAGVTLDLAAEPDVCVLADAALLRRVVDNLVSNAVAHAGTRGKVEIAARACPEGIELAVSDSGPGIPAEYREQVFEKYARLDLREQGVTANRGLGLTFCRLAVEALGGTIWVDEAPGGGARFRAVLPDARPEGGADEEPRRAESA